MIIGKETITVLQEKPQSPPREGYIYLYSYNNLLWYMDFEGNEYCLPSDGAGLISQLLSGNVYWDSGYTFKVSACLYMIRGTTYSSEAGTITLDNADPNLDRIDVIYVDTALAIGKITGTPSANPQKPMVNPASQLELTYVYIAAGSTSPSILNEQVYQENTEWATSWDEEVGGLVNFLGTTNPFAGTYCIEASIDPANPNPNLDGVDIYFDSPAPYDTTAAILVMMIKTSKKWLNTTGGKCYLTLRLYNGATLISQTPVVIKDGKYGFDSSIPSWQAIVVPIVDFGASSLLIDQLNIHFNGKWADKSVVIGFDCIFFQGGVPQPTGHQRLHRMTSPLDHQAADAVDKDKYVHSNAITGEWELVTIETGTSLSGSLELIGDVIGTGNLGTPIPVELEEINDDIGTFGGTNFTVEMEVDAKGRVLSIEEIPIAFPTATDLSVTSGLGSDKTSSGLKTTFVANENQAFGDVVKINSSGKAQLAKADAIANATGVAILIDASVSANGTGNYLLLGFLRADSWNWTKGGWIFLSLTGTTGNTLTQVNPADIPCSVNNVIQMLGVAYSDKVFYFNPQLTQIEYK